mmetsp:Transcript_43561/g.136627  ORF Transcript_43561/g.136627 Transcript_43561/m.136627 type:complete len:540 (-) Transcript_43561:108-1727(-)
MHRILSHTMPGMEAPSIAVEDNKDVGKIIMIYKSRRPGLTPMMIGIVERLAQTIFDLEVAVSIEADKDEEAGRDHAILHIRYISGPAENFRPVGGTLKRRSTIMPSPKKKQEGQQGRCPFSGMALSQISLGAERGSIVELDMDNNDLCQMWFFVEPRGEKLHVFRVGHFFRRHFGMAADGGAAKMSDLFVIQNPASAVWDTSLLKKYGSQVFTMKGIRSGPLYANASDSLRMAGMPLGVTGTLHKLTDGGALLVMHLDAPRKEVLAEMGLEMNSLPRHDMSRDIITLSAQLDAEIENSTNLASAAQKDITSHVREVRVSANRRLLQQFKTTIAVNFFLAALDIVDCASDWIAYTDVLESTRGSQEELAMAYLVCCCLGSLAESYTLIERARFVAARFKDIRKKKVSAIVPAVEARGGDDMQKTHVDSVELARVNDLMRRLRAVFLSLFVENMPMIILTMVFLRVTVEGVIPTSILVSILFSGVSAGMKLGAGIQYLELSRQSVLLTKRVEEFCSRVNQLRMDHGKKPVTLKLSTIAPSG